MGFAGLGSILRRSRLICTSIARSLPVEFFASKLVAGDWQAWALRKKA